MNRRRFLRTVRGGIIVATGGLAGCLGSGDDDEPPPRDAEVFEDVSVADGVMTITLVSTPTVESRVDNVDDGAIVGSLSPVGIARAGSRSSGSSSSGSSGSGGMGASGRGSGGHSSAPSGRHGWAIYGGGGGSDSSWRDDHEDEIETYRASIVTLGAAYVGSNEMYRAKSPGPEPVDWAEKWSNPEPGTTVDVDLGAVTSDSGSDLVPNQTPSEGWYRIGTELESPNGDIDFGWQAADFKLDHGSTDGLSVDEAWHVRPRL